MQVPSYLATRLGLVCVRGETTWTGGGEGVGGGEKGQVQDRKMWSLSHVAGCCPAPIHSPFTRTHEPILASYKQGMDRLIEGMDGWMVPLT
jgi:hypothetical protein